ncbi:MAG: ABC transporter substrate-binding protein [Armatimonadetes bacterium]|nr:ABC transporter substrate-binding protein [Armatimonadota bacterium]
MSPRKIGRRAACRYLLSAAAGGALALSGCGGKTPMGGGYAPDGRIIVNYWNGFTGPDGHTMQAMVRQFQVENRDVVVQEQIIPWGTYYDKLTLSLAYGGAPDVFIMQVFRLPEYASFGAVRPLTDLVAQSGLKAGDFAASAWSRAFYQGTQYGLPLDIFLVGLYYNTRLFEEAGIVDADGKAKPPTTWAEFLEAARKLTKAPHGDQPKQWGFAIQDNHINWCTFAAQYGGAALAADGQHGAMSSPANVAALWQMWDLIYKYKVAPKPEGVDAWLAFRQGRVAMEMAGLFMLHSLQDQAGFPFAGAPVPQFGPHRAAWAGTNVLCQPRGLSPDHARAAWRLMRFLSDHSLTWASAGMAPARANLVNTPAFQALTVQAQFARQIPYICYEPATPQYTGLTAFTDPAIEAVLLDLQTPEDATGEADRRINQLLNRTG